ncbi:UbiA family prenyltransferase [Marisediminicola sp. LYQ134]|uniref:UbiA family prenyltransferase n=1 Tax=Marisediminicola sp. LYQ134 TaxID=3391061 RepID=UPI003983853D
MSSTIGALARATHPGPTVVVTLVTVVLAIGVGLEPWRIGVLGIAMLLGQASVGISNDWIDADRDRTVGRTDKPVATGAVSAAVARSTAIGAAIVAVAASLPLGVLATVAHTVFIASAWLYNAGLKRTLASLVPYLVSFGLLPAIVTLSLAQPAWPGAWALGVGAALGAAAHFANVLPDLDDDRRTGVRGLPHLLGARTTGTLTWIALLASATLALAGPSDGAPVAVVVGFGVLVGIAAVGLTLALTRPPSRTQFRLIMLAALVTVGMLALVGDRLVA